MHGPNGDIDWCENYRSFASSSGTDEQYKMHVPICLATECVEKVSKTVFRCKPKQRRQIDIEVKHDERPRPKGCDTTQPICHCIPCSHKRYLYFQFLNCCYCPRQVPTRE